MSHNGYVQGLLENGAELDIIMASDSWGESDNKLPKWTKAQYYEYNSMSFADKLRNLAKKFIPLPSTTNTTSNNQIQQKQAANIREGVSLRSVAKQIFYTLFKPDPVYPLNATWLKKAAKFKSVVEYDLVISNSSPSASHKLVSILTAKGRIKYKRWVQIWEDPWYHDLYGVYSNAILAEEHTLLQDAQEIYYVSPLTTHYQKIHFADCAHKMKNIPLPFLAFGEERSSADKNVTFGYFGDYYAHTRNLQPFYEAMIATDSRGYIYGNSDLKLHSNEKLVVSGRVTLDVLENVQRQTSVLIHLCNLRGGQIPGKIYHYSATTKPILFILDGTEEEQNIIKEHFAQYDRYFFCNNTKEDIEQAISQLSTNYSKYCGRVVHEFSPQQVVAQLFQ